MLLYYSVCFLVVIIAQLAFLYIHAWRDNQIGMLGEYLVRGMVAGIFFGILFDLVVGHWLGVFDYTFGFVWWFLIFNGALSYGTMIANVYLLSNHSVMHMLGWSVALGSMYELVNYFFPVWEWTFATSGLLEYAVVIGAAYFGLAWFMMVLLRVIYKTRFALIPW